MYYSNKVYVYGLRYCQHSRTPFTLEISDILHLNISKNMQWWVFAGSERSRTVFFFFRYEAFCGPFGVNKLSQDNLCH